MAERARDEAFRSRWLAMPAALSLADQAPDRPPVAIELRTGEESLTVEARGGEVRARAGSAEDADLTLSGSAELLLAVLAGGVELTVAAARGLRFEGDPGVLRRLQGRAPARASGVH
jgi:hypothetical protein